MARTTRIIVRVVRAPKAQRGDIIVVLPESRNVGAEEVLAYSFAISNYIIESLRRLMDRTRATDPHVAAEYKQRFEYIYGAPVRLATKANPDDR